MMGKAFIAAEQDPRSNCYIVFKCLFVQSFCVNGLGQLDPDKIAPVIEMDLSVMWQVGSQ